MADQYKERLRTDLAGVGFTEIDWAITDEVDRARGCNAIQTVDNPNFGKHEKLVLYLDPGNPNKYAELLALTMPFGDNSLSAPDANIHIRVVDGENPGRGTFVHSRRVVDLRDGDGTEYFSAGSVVQSSGPGLKRTDLPRVPNPAAAQGLYDAISKGLLTRPPDRSVDRARYAVLLVLATCSSAWTTHSKP